VTGKGRTKAQIRSLTNLRTKAVAQAWRQEQRLVKQTGEGSRKWNKPQLRQLKRGEKISGYQGHHIRSVAKYPKYAGDPRNITFLTRSDHLRAHKNNFQNPTRGHLIDRSRLTRNLINQRKAQAKVAAPTKEPGPGGAPKGFRSKLQSGFYQFMEKVVVPVATAGPILAPLLVPNQATADLAKQYRMSPREAQVFEMSQRLQDAAADEVKMLSIDQMTKLGGYASSGQTSNRIKRRKR